MITELYRLAQNLRGQKEGINLVHADFGKPGLSLYKTFHLILKEKGGFRLTLLKRPDELFLWTLKSGNFKYFPALRPDSPLIDVPVEEIGRTMNKEQFLNEIGELFQKADFSHLWEKSLNSIGGQLLRISSWKMEGEDGLCLSKLQDFASKFQQFVQNRKLFAEELYKALLQSLTENALSASELKDYQNLLFGSVKESKGKTPKKEYKIQIILDYQPQDECEGVLYSSEIERLVLKCLNQEAACSRTATESEARCSLTHDKVEILNAPYPDWQANAKIELRNKKQITVGFGKAFKPYSKFSDAKCNFRYGKADSEGFFIGREIAGILVAAGASMTKADKYGKTWKTISNGRFSERNGKKSLEKDIVIAYPTLKIPQLNLVSLLSWTEEVLAGTEEKNSLRVPLFIKAAQKFFEVLSQEDGSNTGQVKNYIRILVLRQISNGQVQLVYAEEYIREHVLLSIDRWKKSGDNLPDRLRVPWFGEQGQCLLLNPRLLFPEEAINTLTYEWIDSGKRNLRLQSPPMGCVMDLFFQKEGRWKNSAQRILEVLFPRIEALMKGAGLLIPRNPELIDEGKLREFFSRENSSVLRQSLSLLGTLLYYLNPEIKKYMKETPYLLGQLLAGMDELHKSYCFCVRDRNIPPSLIGNSALGKAADAPLEALAELLERSRIYLVWAKTVEDVLPYQKFKEIGERRKDKTPLDEKEKKELNTYNKQRHIYNARNMLKVLEPLSKEVSASCTLGKTMATEQKAYLFLGYLSGFSDSPEKESSEQKSAE